MLGQNPVTIHNIASKSEAEDRALFFKVEGWSTEITQAFNGLFDLRAAPPSAEAPDSAPSSGSPLQPPVSKPSTGTTLPNLQGQTPAGGAATANASVSSQFPNASPELLALAESYKLANIEYHDLKAITLAQWILESGWGKSPLAKQYNNFAGLKYRDAMDGFATKISYEANDGVDFYCGFDSKDSFIKGYWHFLKRGRYKGWKNHTKSGEDFISFIGPIYTPSKGYVERVLDFLHTAEEILGSGPSVAEVSDSHHQFHGAGNPVLKPTVDKYIATSHKSSRQSANIDHIVIHYTTSRNIQGAINTFLNGRVDPRTGKLIRTSAHYIVGVDGTLVQMVNDSDAAWHAGKKDMNFRSIGIEHCAKQGDRFTPEQEDKSISLIRWLVHEYNIPTANIIPHSAVHSTACPGQILSAYGTTPAEAVKNWVRKMFGEQSLIS